MDQRPAHGDPVRPRTRLAQPQPPRPPRGRAGRPPPVLRLGVRLTNRGLRPGDRRDPADAVAGNPRGLAGQGRDPGKPPRRCRSLAPDRLCHGPARQRGPEPDPGARRRGLLPGLEQGDGGPDPGSRRAESLLGAGGSSASVPRSVRRRSMASGSCWSGSSRGCASSTACPGASRRVERSPAS